MQCSSNENHRCNKTRVPGYPGIWAKSPLVADCVERTSVSVQIMRAIDVTKPGFPDIQAYD